MRCGWQHFCTACHSSFLVASFQQVVDLKHGRRRSVIHFFVCGRCEIICSTQLQNGDSCLSRRKIYEWIERFKQRCTSLCDYERSDNLSTSTAEDNVQVVDGIVMERRGSSAGFTPSINKK
ncbi:hypothetical protein TNCV_2786301 [Trichonephila clavipes]|nr:hypothetical protein TNCV_2786301 [Trichonephila clavipes]